MGYSKGGVNEKALEARERKAAAAKLKRDEEQKKKDDEYWKDDDKYVGAKIRRAQNKEDKERGKLERKNENRRLLLAEEGANMSNKKPGKGTSTKLTRAEIATRQLQVRQEQLKTEEQAIVRNDDYFVENVNRLPQQEAELASADGVEVAAGTGIEAALAVMEESETVDRHPEKRAKAAYRAYEEERIQQIREENPGLKHGQIKERIWKEWQKSTLNPRNQEPNR